MSRPPDLHTANPKKISYYANAGVGGFACELRKKKGRLDDGQKNCGTEKTINTFRRVLVQSTPGEVCVPISFHCIIL